MRKQKRGTNFPVTAIVVAGLGLSLILLRAQTAQEFPPSWGSPPALQTRDYVELPGGYGHGSSTLAKWITTHLDQSAATPVPSEPALPAALYENNLERSEVGKLPDEFMVLAGDFLVKQTGTNRVLELPGSPLDSYALQFGSTESAAVAVTARILGTAKGRRTPTFGVGLGGVAGYKLQVSPGKGTLELVKDQEAKTSMPFDWLSGAWTQFRLQIRQVKAGECKVEGKVWLQGSVEPKDWMVVATETEEPVSGRASVFGSPFASTPIWFDDLRVERVPTK